MTIDHLRHSLRLTDIHIRGTKSHGRRPKLIVDQLEIRCGERVAIVGGPGSGKSVLLSLMAARHRPRIGSVIWDSVNLSDIGPSMVGDRIAYVAQHPTWLRRQLRQVIDPTCGMSDAALLELVSRLSGTDLLARLRDGLDTRLASDDLSPGEAMVVGIARALCYPASLFVFDDPLADLPVEARREFLSLLSELHRPSTVIAALGGRVGPTEISRFDRVIELRAGVIVSDGPAIRWTSAADMHAHRLSPLNSGAIDIGGLEDLP